MTKHMLSDHRLNRIWRHMRGRCYNPKDNAFSKYGGKGVKICQDWGEFINFYNWAMANGYQDGLTIDRIESDGNYEPNNCEWVTRAENCRRAQKGVYDKGSIPVTYKGKSQSLRLWSEELGIKYATLYRRLYVRNIPVEEAFSQEVKSRKPPKWVNNK